MSHYTVATARLRGLLRPRHPVVRQYDRADCGPAALLSVLRFHGGDTSLVHVRELARTDARGSTMLSLVHAATALGPTARGAEGEYDELRGEAMPCLAHVVMDERLQHFVVVYRIDEDGVLLGDPARGRVRTTRAEFERIWKTRRVVLLEPGPALLRQRAPHWAGWIAAHFRREESWLVQSVYLGIVYTVLGLLTAVFVQWVIDRFIPSGDLVKIALAGGALLVLQLLRAGAGYLRQRFLVELNQRVSLGVATEFLDHVFRLPARFFDSRKTGDIMARINDSVKIQGAVLRLAGQTVIDVMMIVGSLAFLFALAPTLGWLALAAVPVYAAILLRSTRRIRDEQADAVRAFAAVEAQYVDALGGIEAVRSFDAGGAFAQVTTRLYSAFQERSARLGRTQARVSLHAELAGGGAGDGRAGAGRGAGDPRRAAGGGDDGRVLPARRDPPQHAAAGGCQPGAAGRLGGRHPADGPAPGGPRARGRRRALPPGARRGAARRALLVGAGAAAAGRGVAGAPPGPRHGAVGDERRRKEHAGAGAGAQVRPRGRCASSSWRGWTLPRWTSTPSRWFRGRWPRCSPRRRKRRRRCTPSSRWRAPGS